MPVWPLWPVGGLADVPKMTTRRGASGSGVVALSGEVGTPWVHAGKP